MFLAPKTAKRHEGSSLCTTGQERLRKNESLHEQINSQSTEFSIHGTPIEIVDRFKYLGRVLANNDDDLPAVRANIAKARARWARVSHVLARTAADPKTMGRFYETMVQAVLLYGSETWVISERMGHLMNSFHHRCARYLVGDHIRQLPSGEWTAPDSAQVLKKAGLKTIQEYISARKNKLQVYAASRPILQKCKESNKLVTNVNQLVWWQ